MHPDVRPCSVSFQEIICQCGFLRKRRMPQVKGERPRHACIEVSLAAPFKLGTGKCRNNAGSARNGVNALFVRKDLRPATVPAAKAGVEWRKGTNAEGCGVLGERPYIEWESEMQELLDMPLEEV